MAFYQVECDSLVIPDNVKYIGQYAFNGINNHIVIGSNVNEIGKNAFGETRSDLQYLETIRLKNPTPQQYRQNKCLITNIQNL
ncbi:MAG: leucine-rich repeat protein [Bacteroidaceae bacterium]|nr:leucine-rich repeat protein [Bacteroidaceae bacterium]